MIFLRSVDVNIPDALQGRYPFDVTSRLITHGLEFTAPVTFFVGENGTGKSTILEAIAAAVSLPAIGGEPVDYDETLVDARRLGKHMKLVWNRRSLRGFFMRSEDFFNFTRRVRHLTQELAQDVEEMEEYLTGYGLELARGSLLGQRQALIDKYGPNLQANSHGEAILQVLTQRLVPEGIYLLDEPETPFSPQRELALLSLIKQMVEEGCQFIIATHSPILLAFPGAVIYSFDENPAAVCAYEDLEHVKLTRDFLNRPEAFLRWL